MSVPIELGIGRLSWPSSERVSDRYGRVMLMRNGDSLTRPTGYEALDKAPVGQHGQLLATILDVRQSTHIGDLFRGFFPGGAQVGQEVLLGEGRLFRVVSDDVPTVGLVPDDGREADWLDPCGLYRCHEQTVRLTFQPTDEGSRS